MTDYAGQAPPRRDYDDMPEATGGEKSIGEALGDVTRDLSVLVQQELALAKAEVRQTASQRAKPPACSPAPQSPPSCSCSSCRSPCGWQSATELGLAGAIIVAVIWLVAGVVLYLVARAQMKKISGIAQTTESVRQVPNALKGHEERNQ